MKNLKIAVGLSGGVDSAVTAMLLKERGYDVTGVTMSVWDGSVDSTEVVKSACYGPDEVDDIESARKICEKIGIKYEVIDLKAEYKECVLKYFREEYAAGRTPNPCVRCNQTVKFGALLTAVKTLGLNKMATGHYARVRFEEGSGRYELLRGADEKKDQSYFLNRLSQEQLSMVMFPLGEMNKDQVKSEAVRLELGLESKQESQDFAAVGKESLLGGDAGPGDIVDITGKVLGQHKGISHYTIGQRRGIGIASAQPMYVIRIDKDKNQILLGLKEDLYSKGLIASSCNWIAMESLEEEIICAVKIRYASKEFACVVKPLADNKVEVRFHEPQSAVTPGQSAVFYMGDLVLGGGVIECEVS